MTDIEAKRKGFDGLGNSFPMSAGTTVEAEVLGGVPCRWVRDTTKSEKNEVVIYIHGGCFTLGSFQSHGPWVSHLVKSLGRDALFIDYRRAPEAPYPSGMHDILSAVAEFMKTHPDVSVSIAGDSAGGGLAVTVMPELMKAWPDRINGCVLISPWVDLNCTNPSYETQAHLDPKLSQSALKEHAAHYLADTPIEEANPMERLDAQFPPTMILVGSDEVLLDDGKLTYKRIRQKQSNCTFRILEGQTHVWVMDDIASEASVSTLDDITAFVDAQSSRKERP